MDFSDLLHRFAAAAVAGNGAALAALFMPDGTYDDYFFGPHTGHEAIKAMLARFADGGRNFRWEFHDPVCSGGLGYASYRFSYDSLHPAADGARVAFAGISRFELDGDLIRRYSEVFDRGTALAQQGYDPERLRSILARYADRLKMHPEWNGHL